MDKNHSSKIYKPMNLHGNIKSAWISTTSECSNKNDNQTENIIEPQKLNKGINNTSSQTLKQAALKDLEEYLRESTLHGLKYVADSALCFFERIFWLVSFTTAIVFAAYFINTLRSKYYSSPIITNMNPIPLDVGKIPFPAITICNMNLVKRAEAEMILTNGTEEDRSFLEDLCGIQSKFQILSSTAREKTENWTNAYNFLTKVSQPCTNMLKKCRWRGKEVDCERIFRPILTEEGLCCTFNLMPVDYIARNPQTERMNHKVAMYEHYNVDDWNPEKGYSDDTLSDVFPFKCLGAGAHLGLTVILQSQKENYYCSSTNSLGFKMSLHNPVEVPKMNAYGQLIFPGYEERIEFTPRMQDASTTLKSMSVEHRKCYYVNERYLQQYRTYSRGNCKLECLVNYTIERCGCAPNFVAISNSTKVCGKLQENCTEATEVWLEKQDDKETEKKCNCLPTCFELDYEKSTTFGKIWKEKNKSLENATILHIFSTNSRWTRITKIEVFGFVEVLSFTGGFLGLFLGVSVLSFIEIWYHVSLKLFCIIIRSKTKRNKWEQQFYGNDAVKTNVDISYI